MPAYWTRQMARQVKPRQAVSGIEARPRLRREGPGASDYTNALRPPTAAAGPMHRAYRRRLGPAAASRIIQRTHSPQRAPYLRL